MSARAIVYPGSFGNSNLPKIGLLYTQPVAGASFDWDSDALPLGTLARWTSSVDGVQMVADGGAPQVINSGAGKAVKFDGIADRMRNFFAMGTTSTVLMVYRLTAPAAAAGHKILYGPSASNIGTVGLSGDASTINVMADGVIKVPSPLIPPDTSWHTMMLGMNGANGVFRHDDFEMPVDFPLVARDGMNLGFASAGTGRTPIEYKRVVVLPTATSAWQRNALVAQMRMQYGI